MHPVARRGRNLAPQDVEPPSMTTVSPLMKPEPGAIRWTARFASSAILPVRRCGICPIAYLLSSCQAMEEALGIHVGGPLRDLRRLIYCG